jgi:predicted dehydrogenase
MAKTYKAAIIGFAHMHINNVAVLFDNHPQVQWAACADTKPLTPELRSAPHTREWNRDRLMGSLDIPKYYDDYREMLSKENIDIAIVTSENSQHPDVTEACAAAGISVCVEKPMAVSYSDARRMRDAAAEAGTTLIVNWPFTWKPAARKIKELLTDGRIGKILTYKMRNSHSGPLGPSARHPGVAETAVPMTGAERGATWWHQSAAGGGAMLDYCGYGAMTSRWYIGEAAVWAVGMRANLNSQYGDADDNAVLVLRYPSAMAVVEASWTTLRPGVPSGPIIYGTEGTLVLDSTGEAPVLRIEKPGEQTEIVTTDPLPRGRSTVAEELIHHLDTGDSLHPTLASDFNLEVMKILDAGMRSADTGMFETIPRRDKL